MEYYFITRNKEIVKIDLIDKNDILIVNEPDNIVAFQADNHENREDFIFDKLKFKKYRRKSKICGKSSIYIKSSNNSVIKIFEINSDITFIFNFNILFYTQDIKIELALEDVTKFAFKNQFFRYECNGNGLIGYYSEGDAIELTLLKDEIIYVEPSYVLGYDKNIKYEFVTYGNTTASLNMEYHYKFIGEGKIIIQTQSLMNDIQQVSEYLGDNVLQRTMKKFIPGADIFMK